MSFSRNALKSTGMMDTPLCLEQGERGGGDLLGVSLEGMQGMEVALLGVVVRVSGKKSTD